MRKLFGTDGIRGKANVYPMDAPTAYKVGASIGSYFRQYGHDAGATPKICIGRDTRISGTMLEGALSAGLCAVGSEAVLLGVISTPGVAFLTQVLKADAGVVISASHNQFVDNGIKIFSDDGFKLPDLTELDIEKIILDGNITDLHVEPHQVGQARLWHDGINRYIESLVGTMGGRRLDGLTIVLDCAHGAAYETAPRVFKELGAKVITVGVEPNGSNINKRVGSLHPEGLRDLVLQYDAHLGVAFDGDADRAIFVDARGQVVDGDQIMAICAKQLKEEGALNKNTLVATVMSNIGLDRAMEAEGIKVVKTDVGDRYVVEEMRRNGFNFGGEQSGHLIFLDKSTTGDGVLAALQITSILVDSSRSLHELVSIMTRYPQVLKNLVVSYKRPLQEMDNVTQTIQRIESELGNDGRVLVRYSGTENKVRVMVEGLDSEKIDTYADEIIFALDQELN